MLGFAGIAWDVKSPFARHFLDGLGYRTGALLGQGVQPVIAKTVADAYDRGLSVPDTAALITENVADAGIVQARMLARTDLNGLANGASVMAATLVGIQYKQWLTAEDDLVRDTHAEADGQTVPVDQAFDVGGEQLDYPGDPAGSDAETCNCRCDAPWTVISDAHVTAAMARPFVGQLWRITTAGGHQISVTGNHPILTRQGWKAAQFIEQGDDLICRVGSDGITGSPDVEEMPTTAEEVYAAVALASGRSERVDRKRVNFHGDVPDSEVDVSVTDDLLTLSGDPSLGKEFAQLALSLSHREMRLHRDPAALVSVPKSDAVSRAAAARRTASVREDQGDRASLYAVLSVEREHAHTGVEVCDDRSDQDAALFVLGSLESLAPRSALSGLLDALPHGHHTDAEIIGDLLVRLAGRVSIDPVVGVEVEAFSGHVYNFQTDGGVYFADGIATANCTIIYTDSATADAETASASPAVRVPSARMNRVPARGFATRPPNVPRVPRMPGRGFAAAVTITVDEPQAAEMAWTADLAFEGAATEDGRYILPDALGWRDLPLSLGAMLDTSHADVVTDAPVIGRIDQITKQPSDDMTTLRATGVFDVNGDQGAEIARMVDEEMLNGVSIDLAVDDWCFRNPETGDLIEPYEMGPAEMEQAMMGSLQYAVRAGTIMGATVCPNPAFADARIAVTASGRPILRLWAPLELEGGALTASAAGLAPSKPPSAWFATPEADEPTPLTVTSDGRVFGHMALWDSCHTGYPGQCVPPPRSPSGYAYFNLGEIECADGSRVAAGALTLDGLHADTDRPLSPQAVRRHYEDTGMVAAFVKAVDGRHGIWVAGTLRADLPERYARDLMGAKPSGDWRQLRPGGPLEMLGVRAVNFPGFPVPRMVAAAMAPSGVRAELQFAES